MGRRRGEECGGGGGRVEGEEGIGGGWGQKTCLLYTSDAADECVNV